MRLCKAAPDVCKHHPARCAAGKYLAFVSTTVETANPEVRRAASAPPAPQQQMTAYLLSRVLPPAPGRSRTHNPGAQAERTPIHSDQLPCRR